MTIIIHFKSGYKLTVTCEEFSIIRNGLSDVTGYEVKGIKDNKLLYIDWQDVSCIYRVMGGDAE